MYNITEEAIKKELKKTLEKYKGKVNITEEEFLIIIRNKDNLKSENDFNKEDLWLERKIIFISQNEDTNYDLSHSIVWITSVYQYKNEYFSIGYPYSHRFYHDIDFNECKLKFGLKKTKEIIKKEIITYK